MDMLKHSSYFIETKAVKYSGHGKVGIEKRALEINFKTKQCRQANYFDHIKIFNTI